MPISHFCDFNVLCSSVLVRLVRFRIFVKKKIVWCCNKVFSIFHFHLPRPYHCTCLACDKKTRRTHHKWYLQQKVRKNTHVKHVGVDTNIVNRLKLGCCAPMTSLKAYSKPTYLKCLYTQKHPTVYLGISWWTFVKLFTRALPDYTLTALCKYWDAYLFIYTCNYIKCMTSLYA